MKRTSTTLVAFTLLVVYSAVVAGQDSASNIRIAGKCVDEKGLPVAEATIDLYLNTDSTKSLKTTQTRPDGSFDLGDFPDPELNPGKDVNYRVVGRKAGKAVNYVALLAPAQKANALDLVLGIPAQLKGIVTGPDGSPLQNARVRVAGYPWIDGVHGAITNKSGEYVLEGIPELEHPGFGRQAIPNAPGLPRLFELQPLAGKFLMVDHPELGSIQPKFAQCPATIDVHFNEPAKMTGRIVDGHGTPVAGVKVTARPSQAPAHRVALFRAMNSGISQGTATTDIDGQYAIVLQHSEAVEINVIDQQHFAETVSDVFVHAGESVPVPDIAAIGAAFVTGRIVDVDTDNTVACPKGVRLHVYVMGEGAVTSTRVRPDGTYRLPVLPGTSYAYFSSKTLDELTKTWDVLEHPTPVTAKNYPVTVAADHSIEINFPVKLK